MEKTPTVAVLLAPGINCDYETAYALELAGAQAVRVHINDLIAGRLSLQDFDGLVLPGGFAFGDDIASGKILGNKLKFLLADPIARFIEAKKPILGICNGFQVMVKMGLLPAFDRDYLTQEVTLTFNTSNKFENRWVHLKADPKSPCIFTRGLDKPIHLPVRHGEGRLIARNDSVQNRLKSGNHVSLRYVDETGSPGEYPINPNGSVLDIAGICDETGLIFGLMPHPEAYVRRTQHPNWTSRQLNEEGDGLALFVNMVEYIKISVL